MCSLTESSHFSITNSKDSYQRARSDRICQKIIAENISSYTRNVPRQGYLAQLSSAGRGSLSTDASKTRTAQEFAPFPPHPALCGAQSFHYKCARPTILEADSTSQTKDDRIASATERASAPP